MFKAPIVARSVLNCNGERWLCSAVDKAEMGAIIA